jgi:hypothetical protein
VPSNDSDDWIIGIDAALQKWSQGDCTVGDHWFAYRFDPKQPLTSESRDVAEADAELTESSVKGFVVITQTCDLVRSCEQRPFLEISPLVEVDAQYLQEIKQMKRPQYAYISGVAEFSLVADLDRVMTVEKSVVAAWDRIVGCQSDQETRDLGQALSRKRSRFAFPDDFNQLAKTLQKRMQTKHGKNNIEGLALQALSEIRVQATPSWSADTINLTFWFIHPQNDDSFQNKKWFELLDSWLELIPASGRFESIDGAVKSLEDLTAKEYVESDRLDLDRLSSS